MLLQKERDRNLIKDREISERKDRQRARKRKDIKRVKVNELEKKRKKKI